MGHSGRRIEKQLMQDAANNRIALSIETRYGIFTAHFSAAGLAELDFPGAETHTIVPQALPSEMESWRAQTEAALESVLTGVAPKTLPPFDLSAGSNFQRKVWAALQTIPPGETLSYQEVATLIHQPKALRAVGQACGANPIPVLIPCHRVLAAHRKLGGFSGGLKWKELLLTLEGHADFAALSGQMSLFGQQRSDKRTK